MKPVSSGKAPDPRFDLIRDTARVRENVVGTWYQVDHVRDGTSSSLTVVQYFADGTLRDEYWNLEHKTRIATHGTDRGRWEMHGDTIVLHLEEQPAAAAATETKPASPPKSPADAPAAAPAAAAPAPNEPLPPHDDEQRLLEAAADWFTYEYRAGLPAGAKEAPPAVISEGVSVRVANDFKLPRFINGYRREGADTEPPTAAEKFFNRIFR